MSTVPSIELTLTGWVVPTEEAILAAVLADMNTAFGGNLNLALETPQGQQAVTLTAIIGDKNNELLSLFNGMDPAFASGRQQDALARIYFLERDPARSTTVAVQVTGEDNTLIPAGSLASSTDGNLYASSGDITIPVGGVATGNFFCVTTGPIVCLAGALNKIYQAIPGWDTITNPTDGSIGNDTETRAAFEARREESVALNARGILPAIQGAVLAVTNVLDAYTTENPGGGPLTTGGYTLVPHSLYVAVSGGLDADVAQAIWSKKPPGCDYNGNTAVTVTDDNSVYVPPIPAYTVTFERPSDLNVTFAITLKNSPSVPSNYATLVKAAVLAAFAGGDGGTRARIGSTIYALRYLTPIAALGAWAQPISIQVSGGNTLNVQIDQRPVLDAGDITVTLV